MPRPDRRARPPRHAFAWLAADWQPVADAPLAEDARARIENWRAAGRPFVVARGEPGDGEDVVRLGLALPDRTRLGFRVAADAIAGVRPPPRLDEVMAAAPAAWAATLARAAAVARPLDVAVQVYGSLAWQALTGLAYLRAGSDADLLLTARRWQDLEAAATALAALAGPPRLDGEAVLPDGGAVAWRELASAPARLLVKHRSGVQLVAYAEVRELFPARAA